MKIEIDFIAICIKMQKDGISKECHTNAKLSFILLKKLGYNLKLVTGNYINLPNKIIKHSWIETKDKILETDCRQLKEDHFDLMPDEFCAVLDKKYFKNRYKEVQK